MPRSIARRGGGGAAAGAPHHDLAPCVQPRVAGEVVRAQAVEGVAGVARVGAAGARAALAPAQEHARHLAHAVPGRVQAQPQLVVLRERAVRVAARRAQHLRPRHHRRVRERRLDVDVRGDPIRLDALVLPAHVLQVAAAHLLRREDLHLRAAERGVRMRVHPCALRAADRDASRRPHPSARRAVPAPRRSPGSAPRPSRRVRAAAAARADRHLPIAPRSPRNRPPTRRRSRPAPSPPRSARGWRPGTPAGTPPRRGTAGRWRSRDRACTTAEGDGGDVGSEASEGRVNPQQQRREACCAGWHQRTDRLRSAKALPLTSRAKRALVPPPGCFGGGTGAKRQGEGPRGWRDASNPIEHG